MKKIIDVDYLFYVAILILSFCSYGLACKPEVTEVWPKQNAEYAPPEVEDTVSLEYVLFDTVVTVNNHQLDSILCLQ